MSQINYRTLNVDLYDADSPLNFPLSTLLPSSLPPPSTASAAASIGTQIRQRLRSGDTAGALQAVLDSAPLGGDEGAKQVHLGTVVDVLQGIRQTDVPRLLSALVEGDGGRARADCLMKYLYKGMASQSTSTSSSSASTKTSVSPQGTGFSQIQARNLGEGGGGQAMSVLLSWHEKLVEIVGVGGIVRVMCDRRTV